MYKGKGKKVTRKQRAKASQESKAFPGAASLDSVFQILINEVATGDMGI